MAAAGALGAQRHYGQHPGLTAPEAVGLQYEPWNLIRQFAVRCRNAGVRYIKVHDTRPTCVSLLLSAIPSLMAALLALEDEQVAGLVLRPAAE